MRLFVQRGVFTLFFSVLFLTLSLPSSYALELLSQEQFAQKFKTAIEKSLPNAKVKVAKPFDLKVTLPDKTESRMFLDNAYDEYRAAPENMDEIFARYMASIKLQSREKAVKNNKMEHAQIVPIVRSRDYLDAFRQYLKKQKSKKGLNIVYEKINEELYAFYSFDSPQAISSMSKDDLKRLKLKLSDVRALAQRNLMRLVGDKISIAQGNGIYMVSMDDNYESSLMLIDAFWSKKNISVKGDYVVFVPTRNVILVTGSQEPKGLQLAKQIALETYQKYGRKISWKGFVRLDGKWQVFQK